MLNTADVVNRSTASQLNSLFALSKIKLVSIFFFNQNTDSLLSLHTKY